MDANLKTTIENHIETCKTKLESHKFKVDVVENGYECLELIDSLLQEGEVVSVGGSMTLFEMGVIDYLEKSDKITYLDRYHAEDPFEVFHQALTCDTYIMSTNALTIDGQLYNVDGNGNRVAALTFGPDRVLVIAGWNKLVKDIPSAIERVEQIAAPANCVRLNKTTPCASLGHCTDCSHQQRICGSKVITTESHLRNRIHVIIVKEDFGY
ncbi:lactate utilization protein [Anaerorhabdus sp.]|uniref:lactate utilization protein n=1 Tax=Anaerorhabdus sp. TaxID=1872524 RepID=UPI002FCC375E